MAKAKKQSSKRAEGTSAVTTTGDESLLQSDIKVISEHAEDAAPLIVPRKRRRNEPEPVDIDRSYLNNLPKMNFALLLSLLMREKDGRVTLRQRDLERADDEHHSILFALSLDSTELHVSVVSTESGIIRSPEANTWVPLDAVARHPTAPANPYLPPPPAALEPLDENAMREQAQTIVQQWQQRGGEPPPGEQQRIVEMPTPAQPAKAKSPEMLFPFEVGSSPQSARQVNLSQIQTELSKDQRIAAEEHEAAVRVEASGSA